jgi:predicted acylesterase/phospholipase RssA
LADERRAIAVRINIRIHTDRFKRRAGNEFAASTTLTTAERQLPFECVTLLLQGGGALGAYQEGVYEALAEASIQPDWIAGISIGAVNATIIAGYPPNSRVDRLREFWTHVTSSTPWDWLGNPLGDLARSDDTRNLLNQMSANFCECWCRNRQTRLTELDTPRHPLDDRKPCQDAAAR